MTTLQRDPIEATTKPARAAHASQPLRLHVIAAVFRRNFQGYFSNPTGYVFITLFVFVCSWVAFWQPAFFANNLASLATLNDWMPYLLLFFIPAITMGAWAEERRQGTDELLLTLPAADLEVVLGKYLAALGIYTAALGFLALGHVPLLMWLGHPDLGVLAATYVGYWYMGAMLIAVGMVASLLSSNVTVGFILGGVLGAIPVFAGMLGSTTGTGVRRGLEELSVPSQFHDFGTGVVSLSGKVYFLSLAAAMLYLNMVLIGRRHWAGGESSRGRGGHATVRALSLFLALASLTILAGRVGGGWSRVDLSVEGLNSLSPDSIALINQIPADRPVYIQAYYSPEVPREYIEVKANLLSLLREYAARAGSRIRLNLVQADLFSDAAADAKKRFGIEPRRVVSIEQGKQEADEIILGVAFTSGLEEVVIPFFDRGLPVEYELSRSIRVVSKSARKKVGILQTDAKLMGGFDMRSMGQNQEWSIVTELKKQYEVSSVSAEAPIPTDLDVLLVAQPSSLPQPQIDKLVAYVRAGKPTLLLMDPLPASDPQIAPETPRQSPGGMFGGGQQPEPKGDLRPLMEALNLDWPTTEIVWSPYNPHPALGDLPPEIVFIGRGDAGADAFNASQPATSGLQEVVLMFPGLLRGRGGPGPEFTPLLKTGDSGGMLQFAESVQQSFMGFGGLNPNRRHFATGRGYTLAARLQGKAAPEPKPADVDEAERKAGKPREPDGAEVRAIVIADLDLISEQFFELRRRKVENLDFDNVTFMLNCVDTLAGDESFVALRKRRPRHRTLERFEEQNRAFVASSQAETKAAEDAAKEKLAGAQKRLDDKVAAIRARTDMDERTKDIMLAQAQEVENRRLEVDKTNIDDERRRKLAEINAEVERKKRAGQNVFRAWAIAWPPLAPFLLGLAIFGVRLGRENRGATPNRIAG